MSSLCFFVTGSNETEPGTFSDNFYGQRVSFNRPQVGFSPQKTISFHSEQIFPPKKSLHEGNEDIHEYDKLSRKYLEFFFEFISIRNDNVNLKKYCKMLISMGTYLAEFKTIHSNNHKRKRLHENKEFTIQNIK